MNINHSIFRWIALCASIFTFGLVVVGGIVRVTGSGLGCPDWPLCHGQLIPPLDGPTLIEYSHRMFASLTSIFVIVTALVATIRYRSEKWIFFPSMLALALLAVQIVLGGITVLFELPAVIVAVHLANALLILASLLFATTFAFRPWISARSVDANTNRYRRLVIASTLGTLFLIASGAVVTGTSAQYTCATWPLCNDQLIPAAPLPQIAMAHRVVAALIGLLIAYALVETWRTRRHIASLKNASAIAALLFLAQIIVSVIMIQTKFDLVWRLAHLAASTAAWSAMVVLTILAYQTERDASLQSPVSNLQSPTSNHESPISQSLNLSISSYLLLTKPWIVALLLVTTLGAMLVAQRGMPPFDLLFFTLLGGACAAGGANTLNSYFDRDKDKVMARTSRRPLPTGRVTPRAALASGIALCILSILIYLVFVNPLSAVLSTAGIVYYAGIYTLWLKPRTPQNVVIGGAAGALPPLVGWAAVTNDVSLLGVYLFLIVFYWTPPHTWALMLMLTKDYQRVGVPMMPVARGEPETRKQILLYSLLLVAITLIPVSMGDLGWFYFLAALALGAYFLFLSLVVLRDPAKSTARRLYLFSNAYLALLFLTMVIDRVRFGI
jgi:heme o synthase